MAYPCKQDFTHELVKCTWCGTIDAKQIGNEASGFIFWIISMHASCLISLTHSCIWLLQHICALRLSQRHVSVFRRGRELIRILNCLNSPHNQNNKILMFTGYCYVITECYHVLFSFCSLKNISSVHIVVDWHKIVCEFCAVNETAGGKKNFAGLQWSTV